MPPGRRVKLARSHRVLMGRAGSCFRPLKNVSEDVVRTAAFWDSSAYSAQHELLFRKYVCASPNLGAEPDTGYPMEIIFDIFVRYRSFVEADYEGVFVAFTRLYIGYMWIHLYPARDNITRMLWTPLLGTISHTYFTEHCHTKLVALAARPNNGNGIKETVWDDLYDTRNIIDNDPRKTAQIDGSPIYIHHPGSFRVAGSFIQGKYKGAHYSFQLLVTNMFRIADEHGLDIGVESDIGMAHRSGVFTKKCVWERWHGDSAYKHFPGVIAPLEERDLTLHPPPLNDAEAAANKEISKRRSIVEHAMALVKNHASLRGVFRGTAPSLIAAYKVTVHTTAYMLRTGGPGSRGSILRVHSLRRHTIRVRGRRRRAERAAAERRRRGGGGQ